MGEDAPLCRISRTKVVLFEIYRANTWRYTHAQRTDALFGPVKCSVKNKILRAIMYPLAYRGFPTQRFYLKKIQIFQETSFCVLQVLLLDFASTIWLILIFTPLESSLKVLSNCVF